jgi:hypothetical protein
MYLVVPRGPAKRSFNAWSLQRGQPPGGGIAIVAVVAEVVVVVVVDELPRANSELELALTLGEFWNVNLWHMPGSQILITRRPRGGTRSP